jgi:asparagine synthase (glutamine-hydrolysing)
MVASLARRGPDGEGIETWPGAILAHRRLAIFDLSDAGRQPMLSPDGKVGVVFNGAIYNFRELRRALEARGYAFRSQTDTEVLVHGFVEWGVDGLVERLRGMFAFAIWDDRDHRLFLVRDRLGVKPLVYATRNGQIAFASTARALRDAGVVRELDEHAVAEYLEFGFVTDDRCIYRDAIKVPAATIVEWAAGEVSRREYWVPPTAARRNGRPADTAAEAEWLLLRAVERRLQADVPVGSLLSGGIDSSLVCWAVAHLGGDVTAFTVGTPSDPWDETADARATAATLGIRHRVLKLAPEQTPDVDDLVSAYAEPFACASALGMLAVSRVVAPEATVLLTGDGGDDVFLGYPEHRHLWLAEKLARALPRTAPAAWMACRDRVPRIGPGRRAVSFLDYATGGLGAVAANHDGMPVYERHGLLGERLAGVSVTSRGIPRSLESGCRVLTDFVAYHRRTRFVGEFMTKVDAATMHYGLEARSPFLDQELWEFAARLPFDVRLRGGRLKAVLREIARRRLGERVAQGRKRGFGVPVQRWLAGKWHETARTLLGDSFLEREGWVRTSRALLLLKRAATDRWAPVQLWYILVLESWLRRECSPVLLNL